MKIFEPRVIDALVEIARPTMENVPFASRLYLAKREKNDDSVKRIFLAPFLTVFDQEIKREICLANFMNFPRTFSPSFSSTLLNRSFQR